MNEASRWRRWVVPTSALLTVALLIFVALYALDRSVTGGSGHLAPHASLQYLFFDEGYITDAVPALAGLIAAVLGIVITVVSIVVQLSASRYHHGVATMFFRDRTNLAVMSFYIVACVCGVLASLSVRSDFVPRATVLAMMAATTVGLALMAPYFTYVFWFLEPTNIIVRIWRQALGAVRQGSDSSQQARCTAAQSRVVGAMEELTDLSSNAISSKDKIIASRAVDALKDFAVEYIPLKGGAAEAWFQLGPSIRENPDFVAMEPESREDLVNSRTWVEWKVMRQYLGIYNEALSLMPDINYLIAIDTRYIGEAAAEAEDKPLIELVFRYLNSYLRYTLNAKNVRTAYNVLNQYRQLVEAMLRTGHGEAATKAVEHMKYYGHISYDMNLPFVTETVAYDVGTLCQLAHERGCPEQQAMLLTFLELDRPASLRSQKKALKGVRKAQVKLAAYYLAAGEKDMAKLVYEDMAEDPPERLVAIRHELERVKTKDFWEITDRGRNFEYMPPPQKAAMRTFFDWFDLSGPEPPSGSA